MKSMREKVEEYIRYKRGLGFKCNAFALRSFAKFADKRAFGDPLTLKTAIQWATSSKAGQKRHADLIGRIGPFAKYLSMTDSRTELIPSKILGLQYSRAEPYIYSEAEIIRLMESNPYHLKWGNDTFSSIIGLLACTGMRIGEVLAIKCCDIDWDKKVLIVRNSKKLPMRLVPLDPSTMIHLLEYSRRWNGKQIKTGNEPFFVSCNGKTINYRAFYHFWKQALNKTGLAGVHHGKNPRLHDLRHTFACNQLLRAYKEKRNIEATLNTLSVYLGHKCVEKTYWYLTGIPALLKLSSKRFEEYVKSRRKGKIS